MATLHRKTVYKTVDVTNPFAEGQDRAYADILMDKMSEMRWWRTFIGAGVLVAFAISLFFFIYAVRLQTTVPVLVNVMPSGETQFLGEVRQGATQVPEAAIVFQVRTFVTNLRSVSTDHQVMYNNIDDLFHMMTQRFAQIMTRTLREDSPFDMVGRVRRTVEIESVLRITERSYQVDWTETTTDPFGRATARMRAVVTVALLPPTDQIMRRNPLGIFVENMEMTEIR